jgi:Cu+-exporting ATPase
VPLDQVAAGDVLLVKPGERVPVDGAVLEGRSSLDTSLLTGESLPVAIEPGSAVSGGTLNQGGAFRMRAERVGADSALMQIVRLVEQAQGSKAAISRLADRVAAVFVPVVMAIAALSAVLWLALGPEPRLVHAMLAMVAVLIIACPCALGLATPTAIVAGTGRGAQLGILMRSADALERAERIDVVVFDKTGTLTVGRPEVRHVGPAAGVDADRLLAIAASVELHSEHPLAGAIVRAARERGLVLVEPGDFSAAPGRGAIALLEGRVVVVGAPELLAEQGATLEALDAERARLEADAHTVIAIAENGTALGLIALRDTLKPGARATVERLRGEGRQVWLITGDQPRTAEAVAREAGIAAECVMAGVRPGGKADAIARLQAQGKRVAMVGDGLNDAPALARADLGIAMGGGADVALEASDLTLVRGDLASVPLALALARQTLRVIRQNLFWAFAYNVLGIPVAAGALYLLLRSGGPIGPVWGWNGLLHPMLASLAMAFSSVSVVSNSLRLRRFSG